MRGKEDRMSCASVVHATKSRHVPGSHCQFCARDFNTLSTRTKSLTTKSLSLSCHHGSLNTVDTKVVSQLHYPIADLLTFHSQGDMGERVAWVCALHGWQWYVQMESAQSTWRLSYMRAKRYMGHGAQLGPYLGECVAGVGASAVMHQPQRQPEHAPQGVCVCGSWLPCRG